MLQSIRDRLTGPIVWFVVALIAVPFAFWGIQSFKSGDSDPVVAKVGDQEITQGQFRQAYQQRYEQYRSLLGENFRADLFDENHFRALTLDDMIQESALRQYAQSQGYRASDATLRDFLVSVPAFQKDGKFSADTYRELLQRQGMKPETYEVQLRQALAIEQLRDTVQTTAFLTPGEVWLAERLEKQTRRITVVPVSAQHFRDKVSVTDAQIADRFETDKDRYRAPERVKLAYIELDRTQLAPADAPATEVLKALYDAERDARFSSTEERRAAHILIPFGADKAAARKKADELLAQIRGGGDFAQLAKEQSSDTGSKAQGGDLGWVRKGMMVPPFEEALYTIAKTGEVVGPVETDFGWHLVKLEEIKPAAVRSYDDAAVQAELLEVYRAREADKRFQDLSSRLEQLAFENTTLEPVATELKLQIKTTDWFTRDGGSGIAAVDAVKQAAFSQPVLQDGENSKPIPANGDAVVVVHKADYEAARQRPLEEVREKVRETVVADAASRLAKEAAAALVEQAKAGRSLSELAQEKGLSVKFEGEASRRQSDLDGWLDDAVFRMPRPAEGKVHVQTVEAGDNVAVVALSAVTDPARPTGSEPADANQASRAREGIAGAEFGAYRKSVEQAVAVKRLEAPKASQPDNPDL